MQKQYIIASDVTDGRQRGKSRPGNLNVKPDRHLKRYFGFSIRLVFSRLLFCVFFGLFSGDLGFSHSHPHPDSPSFLKFFFRVLAGGPWAVDSGHF